MNNSSILPPTFVPGWSDKNSIENIVYRKLGQTDLHVSLITFGAAHIGRGVFIDQQGQLNNSQMAIETIREAIRLGINLIDTSPFYGLGLSEVIVGQALKNVPRKAYYLSTKVGRHPDCSFDYNANAVKYSVERSLKNLGVNYIDLLHIHDVEFSPSIDILVNETLPVLDQLRKEGKIRYIGISGYPLETLKTVVEQSTIRIDVILSYCRYTLWDNELINYLTFFESKNIGIINAAIFGMGLLSESIPKWHPAPENIREACKRARTMCQRHGNVSLYRLALRHSLREKRIATHLIGMERVEMIRDNCSLITRKINERSFDQRIKEQNEEALLDSILAEVFLNKNNWEQIELDRYNRNKDGFIRFLRECSTSGSDNLNRSFE